MTVSTPHLLAALSGLALTTAASANTLYENAPNLDPFAPLAGVNIVDTSLFGVAESYGLTKVVVGGAGWNIDKITTYNSATASNVTGASVHLHIVADADLPTFDPTAVSDIVLGDVTVITPADFFNFGLAEVVVDPLADIFVGPGTYWIGLTPELPGPALSFDPNPAFGYAGLDAGAESVIYSVTTTGQPDTASVVNTWEARDSGQTYAITIEGTEVPEPTSLALFGLGGLMVARRRR